MLEGTHSDRCEKMERGGRGDRLNFDKKITKENRERWEIHVKYKAEV